MHFCTQLRRPCAFLIITSSLISSHVRKYEADVSRRCSRTALNNYYILTLNQSPRFNLATTIRKFAKLTRTLSFGIERQASRGSESNWNRTKLKQIEPKRLKRGNVTVCSIAGKEKKSKAVCFDKEDYATRKEGREWEDGYLDPSARSRVNSFFELEPEWNVVLHMLCFAGETKLVVSRGKAKENGFSISFVNFGSCHRLSCLSSPLKLKEIPRAVRHEGMARVTRSRVYAKCRRARAHARVRTYV